MATDKLFFKSLMAQHGLSLRTVASMMGLAHSQLSLTLSDKRRMQLDEAALLAKIFGVPLARVAEAAGIEHGNEARIQVVGCMVGDGSVLSLNRKQYAALPDGLPEDVIAIQARTADSANSWLDGWNFYCQPSEKLAANALNRFCYAQVADGPAVLATVKRGYEDGTFNLSGPYSDDSVVLEWATPIIMARS